MVLRMYVEHLGGGMDVDAEAGEQMGDSFSIGR